jgi:hypothetical protein
MQWGDTGALALPSSGYAHNFQNYAVATDMDGNAQVLWIFRPSPNQQYQLIASRYNTTNNTWQSPLVLADSGSPGDHIDRAALQSDSAGNMMATWRQQINNYAHIYASYFNATTQQWSSPQLMHPLSQDSVGSSVSHLDSQGRWIVAWTQTAGTATSNLGMNLNVRSFNPNTNAWDASFTTIDSFANPTGLGSITVNGPALRQGLNKQLSLNWAVGKIAESSVRKAVLTHSATSNTWTNLPDFSVSNSNNNSFAMINANGKVHAISRQSSGSTQLLQLRYYDQLTNAWSSPTNLVSKNIPFVITPIMDASGAVSVLLSNEINAFNYTLEVLRYNSANGLVQSLEQVVSNSYSPFSTLRADLAGNIIMLWVQQFNEEDPQAGGSRVYARRRDAASAIWSPASQLSNTVSSDMSNPRLSIDGQGRVHAVWQDNDSDAIHKSLLTVRP